jgi:hypothetical protein
MEFCAKYTLTIVLLLKEIIFTTKIKRFRLSTYNTVPEWKRREHDAGLLNPYSANAENMVSS